MVVLLIRDDFLGRRYRFFVGFVNGGARDIRVRRHLQFLLLLCQYWRLCFQSLLQTVLLLLLLFRRFPVTTLHCSPFFFLIIAVLRIGLGNGLGGVPEAQAIV